MAQIKRKLPDRGQEGVTPKKKPKKEPSSASDANSNTGYPAVSKPTSSTTPVSRILANDQPAFPRGGAGPLSLLERKQIQAKASLDVAREQNGDLFTSGKNDLQNSDDSEVESIEIEEGKPSTKKYKSKQKKKSSDKKAQPDSVAIEGLSYKRLSEESLLLGRVTAIGARDLTVALANNLTGFVPLASISTQFTEKIERALRRDEESDAETDDDPEIDLKAHFDIGQPIRVAVTSLLEERAVKAHSKKKIELSTVPSLVNRGLTRSSLATGCTVQAAVISIEDHGLVVDLGLESGIRGFIPEKAFNLNKSFSSVQEGSVFLCSVTSVSGNGKTVRLTTDLSTNSASKNSPSVQSLLPGTLVDILLTEVNDEGLAGKVMGLLDVTADLVHSGAFKDGEKVVQAYQIGKKIKGRLIASFPISEHKKLGFSVQPHLLNLEEADAPKLKASSIISDASVIRVAPGLGIYLELPTGDVGFAHISRLSDKVVDSLSGTSGAFKIGSKHKTRILDYNSLDGLYILSLQKSVLEQPFLRIDDVHVGQIVNATIEKVLIGESGVQGLILTLAQGVTGLVPQIHMSDVTLQHPEKKFREGMAVKARVLIVNKQKRQIRLTLKKALVNSDQNVWNDIESISNGDSALGTLVKVEQRGAWVQFYGSVRGFLPVSEMSEAYIKDATQHFKIGQVLTLYALNVNPEERRLTVSAREPSNSQEADLSRLLPGSFTSGTIFEKSQSDVLLRLDGSSAIARLAAEQVSDGSEKKRRSALEKLRVGQTLEKLLILNVHRKGRLVNLSNKQSLVQAAAKGKVLTSYEDLREGGEYTGFISNITEDGIFVRFAANISGLIPKNQVSPDSDNIPDFNVERLQAITARVSSIDYRGATPRFWLTMRDSKIDAAHPKEQHKKKEGAPAEVVDPVDESITTYADFAMGKVTKARIVSVKETQINVELAKGVQGRVDVSELFENWEDIRDRKQPLRQFTAKQIIPVRILGAHDTRNHKFLPLSHRSSKNTVFELSARPSAIKEPDFTTLALGDLKLGQSCIVFVNNIIGNILMVNVTHDVRGRIKAIDVADDLSLAADLEKNFPVGSALRARVTNIDLEHKRLDVSARSTDAMHTISIDDLTVGDLLPGRITKILDHSILVQLGQNVVGAVDLIDLADDYDLANTAAYEKDTIVRVSVVQVDKANKRIHLSMRPSKVLNSKLDVRDPEIRSFEQVNVNDVRRGFVSNVSEKGLFVTLGHGVTGFARVSNLSDEYLKDWKDNFQRGQLVEGKVIVVDKDSGHCQLSLKRSHVDRKYKPPLRFTDLKIGDIVTGKIAKVETFGVFLVVDNSENVRGLCHRSEIAEKRIEDVTVLGFNEGDAVKAKVLKIEPDKRRINFGMKASYFVDEEEDESGSSSDVSVENGVLINGNEVGNDPDIDMDNSDSGSDVEEDEAAQVFSGSEASEETEDEVPDTSTEQAAPGLSVGGFDWLGTATNTTVAKRQSAPSDLEEHHDSNRPKKKRKPSVEVDKTGDLDVHGPQSVDDFERLLLGEPSSVELWLRYIAFHIDLGDVDQARQIAEKALKSIGISQEAEKMTIWVALLNLENVYGDDETLETTFKRACEYHDPEEMHNKLVSILIRSGKLEKADELFQQMTKKYTQNAKLWINYATFLFDTKEEPVPARALLPRALQALPSFTHFDVTSAFARLEFKTKTGVPEEGRTRFQGLINLYPKRVDLFNVLLDLESQQQQQADNTDQIRQVYEQIFDGRKLKPNAAKKFFGRWQKFEQEYGDQRKVDAVEVRAAQWVEDYRSRNT